MVTWAGPGGRRAAGARVQGSLGGHLSASVEGCQGAGTAAWGQRARHGFSQELAGHVCNTKRGNQFSRLIRWSPNIGRVVTIGVALFIFCVLDGRILNEINSPAEDVKRVYAYETH